MIIFTPRIDEALSLSACLHRDQVRNNADKTPYSSHLFAVAFLLASVTDDEDVIIAGLMHDSLEDVPHYTYEQLVADCGERVASIVRSVTEPLDANKSVFDQLPWLTRKERYLELLRSGSNESVLVSLADKIHNTENFLADFAREGELFAKRFASIRNRVWFHEQVLAIGKERFGDEHVFVKRLTLCTEEFKKLATLDQPLAN